MVHLILHTSYLILLNLLMLAATASCADTEQPTPAAPGGGEQPGGEQPGGPAITEPVPHSAGNLAATDALERLLPAWEEVGDAKTDKYVGLFYWTWHTQHSGFSTKQAYNVSEILAAHPEAILNFYDPAWPSFSYTNYYWGEPLFGYYINTDRWVLRKHAELLALAGVDVIIFDCTNGNFTWKESYLELCSVFAEARLDGVATPQIAFMMPFGPTDGSREAIEELYRDLYQPGLYRDLFFMWKGKPLIMAYPENLPEGIRQYFTFRPGQPEYNAGPSRSNQWGWLEIYPQHAYGTGNEEVPVGVAQNWSAERGLTAMNAPGVFGRSYTAQSGQQQAPDAVNYGYNFQEQWERALALDPQFIFITGWNEWLAGRQVEWQGVANAFPDQFSQERSRDIEPMKGGHGDNYYYQMAANIRRFKGVSQPAAPSPPATITVDGSFDDWQHVSPIYETPAGNTLQRNSPGWAGIYFTNTTGRNDFVRARVARDAANLYFYIETKDAITPASDPAWMRLFIDSDRTHTTGWEGYDFVVNRVPPSDGKAVIERHTGAGAWEKCGEIPYQVAGNKMELQVPRALVAMNAALNFEFKWSDNMQHDADVMDFYLHGDVAPAGRFNFIYKE